MESVKQNKAVRLEPRPPFAYFAHNDPRKQGRAAKRSGSEATRAQRGLGNTRIVLHDSSKPSNRQVRYDLRNVINDVSRLERVRKCGRVPIGHFVSVRACEDGSRAGYSGLHTCGSVWACPVCAAKISARRTEELQEVLSHAEQDGYRASLLTLTMRHNAGDSLAVMWQALSKAWGLVTSGKGWVQMKERIGLVGWARTVEVTHGAHGWHVHVHALLVSKSDPTLDILSAQHVIGRWSAGLAKYGLESVADSGGFDWECAARGDGAALSAYVAKLGSSGLAAEATLGAFKTAKRGNRTPFQIAQDIATTGDKADLALWWQYERVSKGKRALTWSKTLREYSKIKEISDEEIAAEQVGDEAVALIRNRDWREARSYAGYLLDICESEGVRGLWAALTRLEIPWELPELGAYSWGALSPPDRDFLRACVASNA